MNLKFIRQKNIEYYTRIILYNKLTGENPWPNMTSFGTFEDATATPRKPFG
jgi:hypothetical protein